MKVFVDVYTRDLEAAFGAYKLALESGASDVRLTSNHHYNTKAFQNLNLQFDADHKLNVLNKLDQGPFAKDTDELRYKYK